MDSSTTPLSFSKRNLAMGQQAGSHQPTKQAISINKTEISPKEIKN